MTVVKVCGLRTPEHALVAARAGADLLGMIFAPSRRRIDEETGREIVQRVREQSDVRVVGVFVNELPAEINRVAALCELDYVQLSGDETDDLIQALDVPAIQVVHIGAGENAAVVQERVERTVAELVLLDSGGTGAYGGTGQTFDWTAVPSIKRPFLLAGGLHAGNVFEALRLVRPWGVDVSSGVERDGEKDPNRIRTFVETVRSAAQGNSRQWSTPTEKEWGT